MNVRFREMTFHDLNSVINLCNECFLENTDMDYAIKVFEETNDDPNQIYILGEIDEKIVAHAKITIIPTIYEKMNKYAILNHVCVKKEYRRCKIATKMLDEITIICKNKGCKAIELWSNNYREAAHACYKKYGFIVNDARFFSKEI